MKKTAYVALVGSMAALLFCEPLPVIPPGAYGHDVVVDMHTSGDADLQYSFGTSTDYMPLVFPLTLTAVEGEEREYTMNVVEKTGSGPGNVYTYSYIIDKRPPAVPAVNVSQGLYEGRLSVSFSNQEEEIFFSLNGSAFSRWQSKPLILEPGPDYITRHVIATYARDGSGNLSESAVYTYHLKNTGGLTMSAPVTIHSPQAGVFANDQYLVVEKQKDIRVYYTTDGTPPGQDDPEYTGPVILQKDGQVTVSVAAYNSAGKREYDTQIRYTVSRSEGRMVSRGSGLYDTGLHIEAMEKNLVYTLDDTRPTKESIVFNQSLRLSSVQKGTVLYTLQVAPMVNGEVLDIVFRYVYVIDNSIPREPKFIVNAVLPLNKPATLSMLGDRAAHLHYTLDGSTPGQDSPRYTGPIELSVDGEQGSHFVRGVAFDVHGKKSGEASMVIPYDTKPPAPPVVQAEKIPGGYVVKADDVFGTRTVFEAVWNTDEIPSPTLQSPVWTGDDSVRLPHGMEGTAMFVFMRFDEAGNGSEKIELPLYINNARYPEPVVLFEDGMCSISGEGNIRYAVFDGLRNSVVGEPLLAEYSQPFKIECPEGSLVEKTIAAYSHNGEGKVSNIVVEHIVIDRRIPVVPEIMNIQNHMVYTTSPIRLKPGPKDRDISLHYSFSRDGSEPEDPTSKSPQIENLLIETEEGQEVYYRVKILPLNSRTGRTGAVKELLFAVDRKMPVLPGVTGFTEGAVYNSKVGITLTGIEDGSTGYLSITTDGSEPGDPAVFGVPYSDTVYLYPADESEKPVRLRVGVRDQAGNSVNDPHEYRFTFDKIPPQSPVVEGLPPGGVSVKPLTLRISSPDAGVLYYRIAREDDFSRSESRQFIEYASPVFVDGAAGEKILYFLEVHAQDAVGNSASQPYRYSFVIDRSVPKEAPAPVFTRTGSAYIAEWQPGVSVEYSLDGSTFSLFTGPVLIDGTAGRLKYRLAGSDHVQEYDVPRIIELPSQFFAGVENGSRQAGQVTVQPRYSGGIIRYEVSIDSPSSVSSFSPVFEENLSFDVPSGLTRRYYLNYRYYETKDDLTGFALPPLSFTIDKSPPPVPGVRESIEGTGNKAQKVIQLYGEGNIFYRFAAQGREDPFLPYRDVIRLSSKGREYETYLLQAYAEDTLGNRSPVHEWELIIDQDIVYVSPDGNDYYDGSRLRPVKTLEKAVSLAREQKRTTLYVYPGEYTINRPLVLDSLHIVGSYGGNGTSVIKTGEYFSTDYALALVSGGKANISNIAFSNDSQQVRSILFSKGELTLTGCTVPEPGGTEYLIVQERGNVRMDAMQLSTTGNKGIFRQNGGTAELSRVRFSPPDNETRDYPLITSLRGTMIMNDTHLYPGVSRKSQGYYGVDSVLKVDGGVLHSGAGSVSSSAVVLIDSEASFDNTEIAGDPGTRTLSLVDVLGTDLSITRSYLSGGSLQGSVLVNAASSNVSISYSTLNSGSKGNFAFALKAAGGNVDVTDTLFNGEYARDATVIELKDIEGRILHCLMDINGSSRFIYGIKSMGSKGMVVANSIFINRGNSGTGVYRDSVYLFAFQHNALYGWINYGVVGESAASDIKAFNNLDKNPLGGTIEQNISEDPARSLKSDRLHLQESSGLINRGTGDYGGGLDIDGEKRPNPNSGILPLPDIGLDEVY